MRSKVLLWQSSLGWRIPSHFPISWYNWEIWVCRALSVEKFIFLHSWAVLNVSSKKLARKSLCHPWIWGVNEFPSQVLCSWSLKHLLEKLNSNSLLLMLLQLYTLALSQQQNPWPRIVPGKVQLWAVLWNSSVLPFGAGQWQNSIGKHFLGHWAKLSTMETQVL